MPRTGGLKGAANSGTTRVKGPRLCGPENRVWGTEVEESSGHVRPGHTASFLKLPGWRHNSHSEMHPFK